jgi:hypothetical protein
MSNSINIIRPNIAGDSYGKVGTTLHYDRQWYAVLKDDGLSHTQLRRILNTDRKARKYGFRKHRSSHFCTTMKRRITNFHIGLITREKVFQARMGPTKGELNKLKKEQYITDFLERNHLEKCSLASWCRHYAKDLKTARTTMMRWLKESGILRSFLLFVFF